MGLVAFSDAFTFLAHIDMGNCVGFNFDANGKCIHLEKLYKRILSTKRDNLSFDTLYLATVSSETFRYERKWWSERAVLLDEEINRMIEICKYLGINVIRVPHFESDFCAINSQNGNFYAREYGYPIKTNIKDLSQRQFLNSFSSTEETLAADIFHWHK